MNKRSLLTLALAACAVAALPLRATDEVRTISPELMLALESWSDPAATLESVALDNHPEVLEAYAAAAETFHGVSLHEHFADAWPAAAAAFDAAVADGEGLASEEASSSAEFLAFVMTHRDAEYAAWQAELAPEGLAFGEYVADQHAGLVKELSALDSPAEDGIGLLDFVGADPALSAEAETLLESAQGPAGTDCTCFTVASFPRNPVDWTTDVDEHYVATSSPWRRFDYTVAGSGAARQLDFARQTTRTVWEVERGKASNRTGMQVRMQCTENGSPTGQACTGPTCTGQLFARVGYASRVYEEVTVGGIWSRQSRTLGADRAILSYDPPGAPPLQTLFYKGVAVAGETQSSWNPLTLAMPFYNQVTLYLATPGAASDTTVSADLNNVALTHMAGLTERENTQGSLTRDLQVAWESSGVTPIGLRPNETHFFALDAASLMYSRGYGGQSRGEGHVDSADYLVGVAKSYSCAAGVHPPTPRAHWLYSRAADAPYSKPAMQGFIGTFVNGRLGVTPPNLQGAIGQYP